jgi:hypothetical protein
MTNTVIYAPIGTQAWLDMRLLNSSLKWMRKTDSMRYFDCIKKESMLYKEYKDTYLKEVA